MIRRWLSIADLFLLWPIERASQFIQRLTGRDCFFQRDAVTFAGAAYYLFDGCASALSGDFFRGIVFTLSAVILVVFQVAIGPLQREIDRLVRRGACHGYRNIHKINPSSIAHRLWYTAFVVLLCILGRINVFGLVCLWLRLYLDACDPLGPYSRIRIFSHLKSSRLHPRATNA